MVSGKVDDDFFFHKRKELSRAYSLVAEYTSWQNGYASGNGKFSGFDYLSKYIEYQFLPHYFSHVPKWRIFMRSFSTKRTLPDFCVVGPIKSGSSDLAVNIMSHPNVMPPLTKELFSADLERWRVYYPTKLEKNAFAVRNGMALTPFLAPYLHWMELIYNLSVECPKAKIVLTLRNPVERFYSHWKWEVFMAGKQRSTKLPFLSSYSAYVDKALSVFPESPMFTACGFEPLQTSIYYKAVEYWIERFGRDNVLVLDVQDYFSNGNNCLKKIYDFVGLPAFDAPNVIDKVNENPVIFLPAEEENVARLRDFFEPYNQRLWCLIGDEFNWK